QQHHDRAVVGEDLAGGNRPTHVRQVDVHEDEVRLESSGQPNGCSSGLGFTRDLKAIARLRYDPGNLSERLLVVDDQDSNRHTAEDEAGQARSAMVPAPPWR